MAIIPERNVIPNLEVLVEDETGRLGIASTGLADDVREDLLGLRNRLSRAFDSSVPGLSTATSAAIQEFFDRDGRNTPDLIVVPEDDRTYLREILQSARFRSPSNEDFTTGIHSAIGGLPELDVVIMQDTTKKFRKDLLAEVAAWDCSIAPDQLDLATERHIAQLTVHEKAHLEGSLSASQVVVKRTADGYEINGFTTAGFLTATEVSGVPEYNSDSGYYDGPAIDEGWAAYRASEFILHAEGVADRGLLPLNRRYYAECIIRFGADNFAHPTVGLNSGVAGMIIEAADKHARDLIVNMGKVADGRLNLHDFKTQVQEKVGSNLAGLLSSGGADSWEKLATHFGIDLSADDA